MMHMLMRRQSSPAAEKQRTSASAQIQRHRTSGSCLGGRPAGANTPCASCPLPVKAAAQDTNPHQAAATSDPW
eukprot:CAMPEP_0114149456 /NCGR_PEP_ID=MMETSP0043_2-20121206/22167_1 /TAXON_ID=464988 /ORGANISM="Hemiselmis andersenii, Strain CCMP644" /LENGTH=72 /DNA_ID=CAMNT_0001244097 /DNA_START=158 /DNA_END=373 /DNA_ORIENTATION=-